MPSENTEVMRLLHEDVRSMNGTLGDIRQDIGEVKASITSLGKQIDEHPGKCPAIAALKNGKKSLAPGAAPEVTKLGALSTWSIRLAPLILAAAIGLIGLGFYFASGDADEAVSVMKEIRALADKTTKMSSELKKVQEEIEDGGEKQ